MEKRTKMPVWKRNLYAVWMTQFLSLLGFAFGVPILPYFIQELGVVSPDAVKLYTGLMSAIPAVALGLMAPVWGAAADRFGKKIMMLRAMGFAFLVLLFLGLSQNITQILVIRFFQGILTGTVTASYALIAAGTPDDKMSYALGIISSSIFIGNSAGLVLGGIAADIFGYRLSFIIGAVIMLVGFLWTLLAVKEIKATRQPDIVKAGDKKGSWFSRNKIFLPVIFTVLPLIFIIRVGRTLTNPYIPIYIQEVRGVMEGSATVSGIIRAISSIAVAAAGVFLARLGDRNNKIKLSAVFMGLGAIAVIPMFFTDSLIVFTIFHTLVFLAIGGVEPLLNSRASVSIPSEKRGVLFGIIAMTGSFGWAVSPAIGSFVSIRFSTNAIFLAFSLLLAVGAAASFAVYFREKQKKQAKTKTDI
ncbi:MAG: MFS transporter [Clostridia bacterium]|nr:MFS transporter [Clostridia bacterium]